MHLYSLIADKLIRKKINFIQADLMLTTVKEQPPYYPTWVKFLAHACAAGGSSMLFFGGTWRESFVAFGMGVFIGIFDYISGKSVPFARVFEPFAAFFVSLVASFCNFYLENFCYFAVALPSIIWLLPGLSLTLAIMEFATKNIISGSTRMAAALVISLELGFGLAFGSRALFWTNGIVNASCIGVNPWWKVIIFFVSVLPLNILLDAHPHQWFPM